jgi:hypothetical protein
VSAHEKLLARMKNSAQGWQIDDLLSLAARYGIEVRNSGGSHHVFSYPGLGLRLCVPAHRPIKPIYVRQFVALVEAVKELQR